LFQLYNQLKLKINKTSNKMLYIGTSTVSICCVDGI
jgi:hypothetical protein